MSKQLLFVLLGCVCIVAGAALAAYGAVTASYGRLDLPWPGRSTSTIEPHDSEGGEDCQHRLEADRLLLNERNKSQQLASDRDEAIQARDALRGCQTQWTQSQRELETKMALLQTQLCETQQAHGNAQRAHGDAQQRYEALAKSSRCERDELLAKQASLNQQLDQARCEIRALQQKVKEQCAQIARLQYQYHAPQPKPSCRNQYR